MSENQTSEIIFDQADIDANKGISILMAFIPILFFLPLVIDSMKSSSYMKHRSNQSLWQFILSVGSGFLAIIPFLGWLIGVAVFVFYIINIVNACAGNGKSLPLVGNIQIIK